MTGPSRSGTCDRTRSERDGAESPDGSDEPIHPDADKTSSGVTTLTTLLLRGSRREDYEDLR